MMIYFIQNLETGHLKIGYTSQKPEARLKQLQTGSSATLYLVGYLPGDMETEKRIHDLARGEKGEYHLKGEWYLSSLELVHFIYGQYLTWFYDINGYREISGDDFGFDYLCDFEHALSNLSFGYDSPVNNLYQQAKRAETPRYS